MKYRQLFIFFLLMPAFLLSCKQPVLPAKAVKPVPDISGVYSTGNHGDPQGGGALYVLPNHHFVQVFFGGAVIGSWEINDTTVLFKLQAKPLGFKFYGRHNKQLGNNTRMFFDGFASSGTPAIGLDPQTKKVKQVFDDGPHTNDFHYSARFPGMPVGILLAAHIIDEAGQATADSIWRRYVYNNPNKYNDFVARYYPESTQPKSQNFYGTIKGGKLGFEQKASDKKPLGERDKFFTEQLLSVLANTDKAFFDPYYAEAEPGFEKDTLKYRFNTQKDAYIKIRNYKEGEENKPLKDDGSNSLNIIYQYRELKASITTGQVALDPKPMVVTRLKE